MRQWIVLLFFCAALSMCAQGHKPLLATPVDSVLLKYVSMGIFTPMDVSCDKFETYFDDHASVMIRDSASVAETVRLINDCPVSARSSIDVRCKMYLFTSAGIQVACLGNNTLFFEGCYYDAGTSLEEEVERLVRTGEPTDNETTIDYSPLLSVSLDSLFRYLQERCLPLIGNGESGPVQMVVVYDVDRSGRAVNVRVVGRDRWKGNSLPRLLRQEVERIFREDLRWSPSPFRPSKVMQVFPVDFYLPCD